MWRATDLAPLFYKYNFMMRTMTNFKYNEDKILKEVHEYIESTYGEHYAGGNQKIQIQDVFEQMEISEEFTRGCAMKYLFRFGKKAGKNRKDLLKCMHYICLLYHYAFANEKS